LFLTGSDEFLATPTPLKGSLRWAKIFEGKFDHSLEPDSVYSEQSYPLLSPKGSASSAYTVQSTLLHTCLIY